MIPEGALCKCGHTIEDHYYPDGGMEPCTICMDRDDDCETFEMVECEHDWVDARNQVIESGYWCPKCGGIRQ